VKRFQNLVSVLKQNLSQLQVYRVGNTNINAYIAGVTFGGGLAGRAMNVRSVAGESCHDRHD